MEDNNQDNIKRQDKRKILASLIVPVCIVIAMWTVKLVEFAFHLDLGDWGVVPHSAKGLIGILTMPFLHGNWNHLITNTAPILVLGSALYYCYPTLANRIMILTYLLSGLLTWIMASSGIHIGASALIYGLNFFLIVSGFLRGNKQLVVIALIMVFLYGSFVWGMIPSLAEPQHISWEGHLSGFLVGTVLAFVYKKEGPQKEEYHWDEDDDEDEDDSVDGDGEKPYWDVPMPDVDEITVQYRLRH